MSTPLMKQYAEAKARYPGTVLLFRMGDFYETFEEDAKIASKVLGITLTKRGNGAAGEIPLAGFPHHSLDLYLPRLLKAGHRVAVCEQVEDPKLAKGIVKREVIEVVTPGVSFSDKVLEKKQNNYLASVALPSSVASGDQIVGLAFVDVSTAEFKVSEFPMKHLAEQVASLHPSEILVQARDEGAVQELLSGSFAGLYTRSEDWVFSRDYGYDLLVRQFNTQSLKGFGIDDMSVGIIAAGAVMNYLRETQKSNLSHLRKIVPHDISGYIVLDPSTKRNLEITSSLSGSSDGTLFSVLDRTRTPMGGRMLNRWINLPLNRLEPIVERLEAVAELVDSKDATQQLATSLDAIGDLERLNTRICTARATPRDLHGLRVILESVSTLTSIDLHAPALRAIVESLDPLPDVIGTIRSAIEEDAPAAVTGGGVIRKGYNEELDSWRAIAFSGKSWIADMQSKERERSGIGSLKVGFNNVFGYYIEITNTHKEKVPAEYIRKQTLTNAERYITPELKEYEDKVLQAEERITTLETQLFHEILSAISGHAEAIQQDATGIAMLDCFVSLAEVAGAFEYRRPVINESTELVIEQGRHPVIERLLKVGEQYTPNSVRLDTGDNQILIITGPNMSGKSSFLRQTGLIVLLAQIGSFVPARKAEIGIVDRIYTRVGASDNIASGESTFLVEMHEAAHILNTASTRSLILLDEVGRGTSTFDGISIAWALTEYLHNRIHARTLFATHYHELNELAELFPRIKNYKVDVKEYGDKVVFLHTVTPGSADHSYGIQVAQMAGLPDEVTDRAKDLLKNLEQADLSPLASGPRVSLGSSPMQMTLFEMHDDTLRQEILKIDTDSLTPLEALQKLAQLKQSLTKEKP